MKVFEIFIVWASLIALSCAVPLKNFPTSNHEDNLRLAYQTLGVSRIEESRRKHPEERNFEYHLRPTQQYHEDYEEELQRRGHPSGGTTTHIQSFIGNEDDHPQLVRSGGSYVLSNSPHILRSPLERDQQQAELSQVRTSEARIDLPIGRRGPLYALVQNEDYQQPATFQQSQAATETRSGINERQQQVQITNNDNFQQQVRILEEQEYTHPRSIQQTVEEQTQQHQNIDHLRALPNHLNARPSTNEDFIEVVSSAGHLHRFANAENQRRREQEAREQHEEQLQTQLLLQQQLHEHHRQQALQLQELERREKARRINTIQTLDEQRNVRVVRPTQDVHSVLHLQEEADRSGPKFALVDYERSENPKRNERVFFNPEEVHQNRPIRIRQQVSNPTQERRGPVNSVPSLTAEVAQATADHFNFYNSVAKNLPVLSLEETDPEAAAILRARHAARLHPDGILLAEVE